MNRKIVLCLLSVMASVLFSIDIRAQEKGGDDKSRSMQEAQKLGMPGDEHKKLAQLAGTWQMEAKFFLSPGSNPLIAHGGAENRMILGGRFLKSEVKGSGPLSFEGLNIIGFDRRYSKYTMVEYDTEGTYYVTADGQFDPASNSILLSGEADGPTAGVTEKYNTNIRIPGPDTYIVEIVFKNPEMTGGAKEFKAVEMTFTRAK
ncbi:MAG TPA: DUF1579 family protein [Blastocatellia bacterium]